jgi:hypothetical protein
MDRRRVALWATLLFSAAAVVGVLLQVFFIGAYIFGEPDALDIHKNLGKLVHLFYVLTFVAALVAAWPAAWRRTGWPFALAVLGSVQAFLAGGGSDVSPWVHAFHAALVPIVFVIAMRIAMGAKDTLGLGTTSSVDRARSF